MQNMVWEEDCCYYFCMGLPLLFLLFFCSVIHHFPQPLYSKPSSSVSAAASPLLDMVRELCLGLTGSRAVPGCVTVPSHRPLLCQVNVQIHCIQAKQRQSGAQEGKCKEHSPTTAPFISVSVPTWQGKRRLEKHFPL